MVTLTKPNPILETNRPDVSLRNADITTDFVSPQLFQAAHFDFDWVSNTDAFQRIRALRTLKPNWDSYGAPIFNIKQVEIALGLCTIVYKYYLARNLSFTANQPFIAPSSDGSILFEWSGKRFPSKELEISVVYRNSDIVFAYLKSNAEIEDEEEEGKISLDKVCLLLDWLFEQ